MRRLFFVLIIAITGLPGSAGAQDSPVVQDRSSEPVVLNGSSFPAWSAGPDIAAREPQVPTEYDTADPPVPQSDCYDADNPDGYYGDHNCYQSSRVPQNPNTGAPVERLRGYRWTGDGFEQIPFQVDERAVRFLTNNASGFAFYSGVDRHETYVWDDERFRYTSNPADDPCQSQPANGARSTPDTIAGLDDNDELVFMWRDASGQAPLDAPKPEGVTGMSEVRIDDPTAPDGVRYAYVALTDGTVATRYDSSNSPYVRYVRDADADRFVFSQSSYDNYGNAPHGPYCAEDGVTPAGVGQRRPKDTAWVFTNRYAFRYDGRWLMTQLRVAQGDELAAPATSADAYGPDLIDQWKARAFQQRPGGTTPCCGYEEEVNNWGGSSILFGERSGAVRVIREAWGADSSTNNNKREVFYGSEVRFIDYLRVHVIPPADGIYVQWDYNPGKVDTYYNPNQPQGVPADGKSDEVFGNFDVHIGSDRIEIDSHDENFPVLGKPAVMVPLQGGDPEGCDFFGEDGICNDIDQPDPFFSGAVGNLNWEQVSGPFGGWVTRWGFKEITPGGFAQGVIAQPYYRDDSCFDDGTGSTPGPHLKGRAEDIGPARPSRGETFEGNAEDYFDVFANAYLPRRCWTPSDGEPTLSPSGARTFVQGDIATHGLHLNLIADSDNAATTLPLTEIDSEQRAVVIPPGTGNVGESRGRGTEFPLRASATPLA